MACGGIGFRPVPAQENHGEPDLHCFPGSPSPAHPMCDQRRRCEASGPGGWRAARDIHRRYTHDVHQHHGHTDRGLGRRGDGEQRVPRLHMVHRAQLQLFLQRVWISTLESKPMQCVWPSCKLLVVSSVKHCYHFLCTIEPLECWSNKRIMITSVSTTSGACKWKWWVEAVR